MWGANISSLTTKQVRSTLARYQKYLAHKEGVAVKHKPGTPYHTRAIREAGAARERIAILENELKKR